jgi:hypothetical protein
MFAHIEENLEKIKNPDDVNIIKPKKLENGGFVIVAGINNGEAVQLTKPTGKLHFPEDPIYCLSMEYGRFYFKGFGIIQNFVAINKNHLTELKYLDSQKLDPKGQRVGVYVCFDDGNMVFLAEPKRKYFFNKFKPELEQMFGVQCKDVTQEAIDNKELEMYL